MPLPLIPTNTVAVSPTYYPPGWFVAAYDDQGFADQRQWFPAEQWEIADNYARQLEADIASN